MWLWSSAVVGMRSKETLMGDGSNNYVANFRVILLNLKSLVDYLVKIYEFRGRKHDVTFTVKCTNEMKKCIHIKWKLKVLKQHMLSHNCDICYCVSF